jgi:hypothetical protein
MTTIIFIIVKQIVMITKNATTVVTITRTTSYDAPVKMRSE